MKTFKTVILLRRFVATVFVLTVLTNAAFSQTWVSQTSGTTNTLHSVYFLDVQKGFAVGDAGTIRYTVNGGQNWIAINGVAAEDLHDVAFQTAAVGIIIGDNGRIYRSTNGGTVWVLQASGITNNLRTVTFGANNMVYAAGVDGVIIRSTNNGVNWSTVTTGTIRYRGSSGRGAKVWIVGDGGVIHASINNGASFSPQGANTSSDLHNIYMLNELTGYAGGQNNTLLYTADGGAQWVSRSAGINQSVNAIHFSNTNTGWVVCSAGAIFMSSNAGTSWVNDNSGTVTELNDVAFPDINQGWAVGAGGVIKHRSGTIGIVNISNIAPDRFSLGQNYPNPFNPSTKIEFDVPAGTSGEVRLSVYDITGQEVSVLVNQKLSAGSYETDWNASQNASGVYFYKLTSNNFSSVRKMMLVK
jgi:photosystem II stability/assembly factor-like uncharacterized protein